MAKKWLKYPNGVEVVVKEADAERHRDRIVGELLARKAKNPSVEILDKPSYEGGHSDRRERADAPPKTKAAK